MSEVLPRRRSPLIYLGGPVIALVMWWLNPILFNSNACKSSNPHDRAIALDLNGDKAGAVDAYTEYLRDHPDDVQALFSRGVADLRLNRTDAAIADFTAVLQRRPGDYAAYDWRGDAHLLRRDYDDAISDYTRSMARPPEALPGPFYSRGLAYLGAGRFDLAQADFIAALKISGDGPGKVYLEKGRDCAARQSQDGACATLPLDPNPLATHLFDVGGQTLSGC